MSEPPAQPEAREEHPERDKRDQEPEPAGADRFKRAVRPALMVIAFVFVAFSVRDLVERWDGAKLDINVFWLAISLLPALLASLVQGLGWIVLVERMAHTRTPRLRALGLYLDSQLARYTPGKVGLPLVRMEGAPRLGLARGLVGASVLIEMLSWTGTGAVLGFGLLLALPSARTSGLVGGAALLLLVASLLGVLLLVALDRSKYPSKLVSALGAQGEGPLVPLRLPLIQLGYWLLWAVQGVLTSHALGAPFELALKGAGFFVLAPVAGFVALLAPAGLGVREAMLIAGLAPSIGAAAALGVTIASRAASLVADFGTWAAVRVVVKVGRADE